MTYYKVIRNSTVIDVGFVFLKWNETKHKLYLCDVNEAQFVQSRDGDTVYHAEWLKPYPAEAGYYEPVDVVMIDENEYDEIRAFLEDGEEIPYEPDDPTPEPQPEPEPDEPDDPEEEEHKMTISEMRQTLTDMMEQVGLLTECILEMSEVVYFG